MAEVTVKELADLVGTPVEKLLKQMQDAGLSHANAEQVVKDDEKQQLLGFLKRSHGGDEAGAGRITLQRKSVSQLKLSGSQGRTKTVSVEVRKKRTYVKRSVLEAEQPEQQEDAQKIEEFVAEPEVIVEEPILAPQANAEAKVDAVVGDDAEYASTAVIDSPKSARITQKTAAIKSTTAAAKDILHAKLHDDENRQKKEEQRRREDESKRKLRSDAEDKARQRTLEEARRIAAELEHRSAVVPEEETADNEDRLVRQAFEESIAQEEKRARRTIRKPVVKLNKAKTKGGAQHGFTQPTQPMVREVALGSSISVADLASQMSIKVNTVVKSLMAMGVVANITQQIDQDTAVLVIEELGHKYTLVNENALEHALEQQHSDQQSEDNKPRAPVVTIMGHVDHGKTSLLDYIRRAKVAAGEAGGITQHIGAYHVETSRGMITFLDTPGHAAFTAMRARGAQSTDIVILVVAADDGVMPQTEEAIDHARAAGVPIVVAVNKMDKEGADLDRVTNELAMKKELLPESWGGDTPFIPVSAHSGEGIDALLETVLLQAELLELKAPTEGSAKGVVIESRLDKGRGPVVSLLVQSGCLRQGDVVLAGSFYGRVRAMLDENGKPIEAAGPSIPVEILGLMGVPDAGDVFLVVPDERTAREVAQFRNDKERAEKMQRQQKSGLENAFENLKADQKAKINIVLKTDVRGSLEALHGALAGLGNDEVSLNIVGSGVGGINETDANLALTSNAVVIGFNVRADNTARKICQDGGLEIRYYSVIYNIIEDMKAALSGLLKPERQEEILGVAEVREVFHSSKFGAAAGCMVLEGSLYRNKRIRVLRKDVVIFEGELESLRRFKDDVSEVRNGMECGLAVRSYNDVKAGDKIEAYNVKEIARTL